MMQKVFFRFGRKTQIVPQMKRSFGLLTNFETTQPAKEGSLPDSTNEDNLIKL